MIPMPIAFLAQGSGSSEHVARAKRGKFKSVALQGSKANDQAVKAFRDAGFFVCEWDVVGAETKLHAGTQGFIPQVEGPEQFDGAVAALKAGVGAGLEKAVVTNFWGLYDPTNDTTLRSGSRYALLKSLGVSACLVESYAADGANFANLPAHMWQGTVYGIPSADEIPLVGTYRGEIPSDYIDIAKYAPRYGIYIIEQTGDEQLDRFAKLIPDAPVVPVVPNPADVNAEISRLAHTWLDPHPGDDALSRLRAIERIANTTDNEWVNARSRVKSALDSVGA